ncbi:CHRD domain-containing protein [Oxalobacteraceae bacterium A2-2]
MKKVIYAALAVAGMTAAAASQAALYMTIMNGPTQSPMNNSPATGSVVLIYEPGTHMLTINSAFAGLLANSTGGHIHCCTPVSGGGDAAIAIDSPNLPGFPVGSRFGPYTRTLNTSIPATWDPAFLAAHGGTTAGAEAALLAGLSGGKAYFDVHSVNYPNGEIRGYLKGVGLAAESD